MTNDIAHTIAASVPIILLIALGLLLRRIRLLTDVGVGEIKALIVRVALPALFFSAFLTVDLDVGYLGVVVLITLVLATLLALGYLCERPLGGERATPFLMTGFEFGMLGISLFGTAYGMEHVGVISVVGLPHELFIWFVFVTLLQARYGGRQGIGATIGSFVRSPIIIAIVAGALLNLAGVGAVLTTSIVVRPVLRAMELLGALIAPLILIVIGYGVRLSRVGFTRALPVVLVRFTVVLVLAPTVVPWAIERVMGLERIVTHAVVTFMFLPPPFIVPLYIPAERSDDLAFANNVLSLSTLISIAAFLVYFWFNPA